MRRSTMTGGAVLAFLAASLSPSATAASAATHDVTPPDKVSIEVVNVNGSGCPAGTAAVSAAPDNTAFTVAYSDYTAQVGRGAGPTDVRKNCQLSLNVHVPQGYTYAIAQADYRGFAHLEKGASGLQRAGYYFQGMSQTAYVDHPFTGSTDDNWQHSDVTAVESLVYAPCGAERLLNVNTELRVKAGSSDSRSTSFISMDSTDGSVNTLYHFSWKRCPGSHHG